MDRKPYGIDFWTGRSWLAYGAAATAGAARRKAAELQMVRRAGEKIFGHHPNEIRITFNGSHMESA